MKNTVRSLHHLDKNERLHPRKGNKIRREKWSKMEIILMGLSLCDTNGPTIDIGVKKEECFLQILVSY